VLVSDVLVITAYGLLQKHNDKKIQGCYKNIPISAINLNIAIIQSSCDVWEDV